MTLTVWAPDPNGQCRSGIIARSTREYELRKRRASEDDRSAARLEKARRFECCDRGRPETRNVVEVLQVRLVGGLYLPGPGHEAVAARYECREQRVGRKGGVDVIAAQKHARP